MNFTPPTGLTPNVKGYIANYMQGQYMNFNAANGFFWDLPPDRRGIIEVNQKNVSTAQRKFSDPRYISRKDAQFEGVLSKLAEPSIKKKTWVVDIVQSIYRELRAFHFVKTYEAYHEGNLCGAVLGIDLYPVFVAETMFFSPGESGASKHCLAAMLGDLLTRDYVFVDTQMVHASTHPAARMGEIEISLSDFKERIRKLCHWFWDI